MNSIKVTYLIFPGTAEKPGPPDLARWGMKCKQLLDEIGGTIPELMRGKISFRLGRPQPPRPLLRRHRLPHPPRVLLVLPIADSFIPTAISRDCIATNFIPNTEPPQLPHRPDFLPSTDISVRVSTPTPSPALDSPDPGAPLSLPTPPLSRLLPFPAPTSTSLPDGDVSHSRRRPLRLHLPPPHRILPGLNLLLRLRRLQQS